MEEQQKSIDEIFRQSLGDYREAPPAAAWEKVAARLDDDGSRRRRFFPGWPWTTLLILLMAGGAWFFAARRDGSNGQATAPDNRKIAATVAQDTSTADSRDTQEYDSTARNSPAQNAEDNKARNQRAPAAGNSGGHKGTRRDRGHMHARNYARTNRSHVSAGRHRQRITVASQRSGQPDGSPSADTRRETSAASSPANKANVQAAPVSKERVATTRRQPAKTANTGLNRQRTMSSSTDAPDSANSESKDDLQAGRIAGSPKSNGGRVQKVTAASGTNISGTGSKQSDGVTSSARKASTGSKSGAANTKRAGATGKKAVTASSTGDARPATAAGSTADGADKSLPAGNVATPSRKIRAARNAGKVASSKSVQEPAAANDATPIASGTVQTKSTDTRKQPAGNRSTNTVSGDVSGRQPYAAKSAGSRRAAPTTPASKEPTGKTLPDAARKGGSGEQKTAVQNGGDRATRTPTGNRSAGRSTTDGAVSGRARPAKPEGSARSAGKPVAEKPAVSKPARTVNPGPAVAKNTGIVPPAPVTGKPVTTKSASAEKPIPPVVKPEQAAKAPPATREPAVSAWYPTPATPSPSSATTYTEGSDAAGTDEEDEADQNQRPNGSGSGGGGGASPAGSGGPKTSISLAALVGFETGFAKPAPNNITGSFRLLWHFDPAIAVGIQPTLRYGRLSSTQVLGSQAYQRTATRVDSVIRRDTAGNVNYRSYNVSETFDSIVVAGLSAAGTMWQIELPIILSYNIARHWRIYGGPSVNLGGKLQSGTGSTETFTTVRRDSVTAPGGTVLPARPASSFEGYFGTSNLPPIEQRRPEDEVLQNPAALRFGYLFGLGYEWKRIIFDASVHQQVSGYSDVASPVRKVYTSPYLRLSFGYTLFPQKNARVRAAE